MRYNNIEIHTWRTNDAGAKYIWGRPPSMDHIHSDQIWNTY